MRTQSVSTSKIPVTAVSAQCVLRAALHISTTQMFYILFFSEGKQCCLVGAYKKCGIENVFKEKMPHVDFE